MMRARLEGWRRARLRWAPAIAFVAAATFVSPAPAYAQSAEDFFHTHTMTIYVPSGAGGVNDLSARLIAKHLPRFLAGAPRIVVENVPGAGGLTLANRLVNTLPRDGSVLTVLERGTPQTAIAGDPAVRFDPSALTWLGSLSSYADDAYLLIVNSDFAAHSLADLQKAGGPVARLGTTGPGATNRTIPLIARALFGLHLDLVRGYPGAPAISLAQNAKEVDGQVTGWSYIEANQWPQWQAGDFRALLAFARTSRHPKLPDVPIAEELVKNDRDRALLQFAELPFFMALPVAAPPGLPADRAQALTQAFAAMFRDPDFIKEGDALKLELSPIDAGAVKNLIAHAMATPPDIIVRYNNLISAEP
jgi:tripartite-type tricarboxylate transporter receptor subunit TctC